ncbi:MAG: hypothetical protein LCH67_08210 [Bacteroidetes bacterium]|nr:hypothetical protein [Bacteroidota bacterium]
MDNIKYSLFDLFSFLIPGCILVLFVGLVLPYHLECHPNLNFISFAKIELKEINSSLIIIFLLVSYSSGYITSGFITILTQRFKKKLFLKKFEANKIVKVREHAPQNYAYIDRFNALRLMSWNIALNLFIIQVLILVWYLYFNYIFLTLFINISIIIILVLLGRTLNNWAVDDCNETFDQL